MTIIPRNPYALAAKMRRVSIFHDRRDPRGGARNMQEEYLKDWYYTAPIWFDDTVDFIWDNKEYLLSLNSNELFFELMDLGLDVLSSSVTDEIIKNKCLLSESFSKKELSDNLAELLRDFIL